MRCYHSVAAPICSLFKAPANDHLQPPTPPTVSGGADANNSSCHFELPASSGLYAMHVIIFFLHSFSLLNKMKPDVWIPSLF